MLFLILGHLGDCVVLVMLVFFPLDGLRPEHPGQKLSIVSNPFQLGINLFLKLFGFFQFWDVIILILIRLFLNILQLLPLLNFVTA